MRTDWNPPVAPDRVLDSPTIVGEHAPTSQRLDDPVGIAGPSASRARPSASAAGPTAGTAGPIVRLGYRTLRATDPVTGLGNAHCWSQRASLPQCHAYWQHEPVAVLAVDIDHFAMINNEYGHPAGDDLLRSVGKLIRSAARPADLVCRRVADEFLILAPGLDADAALDLGARIRDRVRLLVTEATASVDWFVTITDVTVSVGIAVSEHLAPADLLTKARGALKHIKSYGHDLICLADPGAAATNWDRSATVCTLR